MRHLNHRNKLSRTSSHRRCLIANMLKSLIHHGRIVTTVEKAKELRRYADHMVTLAKKNDLAARRQAIGELMIRFNALTSKQARAAKEGVTNSYNADRTIITTLFGDLGPRFVDRKGGYTRIVRTGRRVGDNAQTCIIEFLEA